MYLESYEITPHRSVHRIHQNIMETLVSEEVAKQLRHLPKRLNGYVDPIDVATHALNRLPPLYASSEQGKLYQLQIGRTHFKAKIAMAVRQAIAAVQQDPLRKTVPLTSSIHEDYQNALTALHNLQAMLAEHYLLDGEDITWDNLGHVVRQALKKVVRPQKIALSRLTKLLEEYNFSIENRLTWNNLVDVVQMALERRQLMLTVNSPSEAKRQE